MLDTLFAGLIHGNAYALVAVGLSLIFGVTHVANFAHGSVFALGTMLGWWFIAVLGWPLWAALIGVVIITAVLGLVINQVTIRPLASAPPIAALLATVAVALILDNLSQLVFGPQTRAFPAALPTHNLHLGGLRFGTSDVVMFGVTIASMTGLAVYLRRGRSGRAIRATAQDSEAALQMGIHVPRIQNLAFVIASALGGVAGVFVGMFNSNVNPATGSTAGLTAFVAATLGGLGSMPGAVVGGLVLGVVEAFGVAAWGDGVRDLITFGVLLVVLVVRPGGLFGKVATLTAEPLTGTFLGAGRPIRVRWWQGVVVIVLAATLVPLLANGYFLIVATQVLLYAIVAVALTLVAGSAGQITLGQAGPIALGAYTSALLVQHAGWPFLATVLVGGLVAAVASAILTFPVWRLRGHYVAIATLGVGILTVALIRNADGLTRGAYGLTGIAPPELFGHVVTTPAGYYLLDLGALVLTLGVVTLLRRSHLGKVFAAVGADDTAARSSGVRSRDYRALAFAIAAFFAGVSGALLAHQYAYIDPTVFNQGMSLLVLTIAVLGGLASPVGAVLGSVVLVGAPELLRLAPQVRILSYGVLLLAIIRFRPQGIWIRK
ncbi:MAG: ABC transporter permease [Cellulomonas sp.]